MVNAYIEDSYKLVFPLFCEGYLNLDYDMAVNHPTTLESSGVLVNNLLNYTSGSGSVIAVDTVDATTKFAKGDNVFTSSGALVGVVASVVATQITFVSAIAQNLNNNENLKKNITSTSSLRNRNIWSDDSEVGLSNGFVLEAIITPYDVNGIGSRTAGRHGVLDSQKTPPYPNDNSSDVADRNAYESVDYLGASAYLSQKMMLFHNANLQFYLQNITSTSSVTGSSYNQPAEYKLVAELTKGGVTKKIESGKIIGATSDLQGYYDPSGYYHGLTTSYQRVSASATGSNPQGTVTIADYDDLEVDTQATGQVVIGASDIANYVSPIAATGSYTIANANSIPCNTPPTYATAIVAVNGLMTAGYNSGNGPLAADYLEIKHSNGTSIKFYQFNNGSQPDGRSSGTSLASYSDSAGTEYGTESYLYLDTDNNSFAASTTTAATSLTTAINAARTAGDLDINTATSSGKTVSLVSAATNPSYHNNDQNGIGTGTWVTTGGPSSGAIYSVAGWGASYGSPTQTNGVDEVEDIEFITIESTDGTTKKYKASIDSAHSTGDVITDSANNQCVLFKIGANATQTATSLRTAINHTNGHNGKITVSTSGTARTLTQATVGVGGNNTITRTGGITDTHVTIAGFTGGIDEANATSTPHIVLQDSSGVTKNYVPVANGDAKANGFSGTIGSVTGVAFQEGANATATGANLATAIAHANGHNGSITASNASGTVSLTQGTVGTAGNKTITLNNTSNVTKTDFSGGATPDNFISITDAAGTLKKYKASTVNVTGTTDGTYTFFKAETNNDTTASNLETAIDGANGHNGTLITTTASNVVTVKLNQAAMGSAAMSDNVTDLTTVNFSAGTSNEISVSSGEATEIGPGCKIYNATLQELGTVESVSGDAITLTSAPTNSITSVIYTDQIKEALYLEQAYKVSLVYGQNNVELYLNNGLLKQESHTVAPFSLDNSDCRIGRGPTDGSGGNNTQFFGELFEIAMHKGKRPCNTVNTLTPGYSDILFYYTFGD